MNTIIFIIIVVILICISIVTFLLLKRHSKKRKGVDGYGPIMYGPIMSGSSQVHIGSDASVVELVRQERAKKRGRISSKTRIFQKEIQDLYCSSSVIVERICLIVCSANISPVTTFSGKKMMIKALPIKTVTEHLRDIELKEGLKVRIKLSSPVLSFSDPVIK